jgi:DoxX-like family
MARGADCQYTGGAFRSIAIPGIPMSTIDSNAVLSTHAEQGLPATQAPKKWALWTGRVLSGLSSVMLLMSAAMKVTQQPQVLQALGGQFGYPEGMALGIGLVELACVVLYLLPRTAVLGAVLLTGYLGGAVATHVRISDPYISPVLVGVVIWAGLYLRDPRVRALLPLQRSI